jgi:voltage-gated potassium channel
MVNPLRRLSRLRAYLRALYHGRTPGAQRFRLRIIWLDFVLIAIFIAAPFVREEVAFIALDYAMAFIVGVEIVARALATQHFKRWFIRHGLVDLVVLTTLLFPLWLANFAFLRVLRLWSLIHSDFFWETIGRKYDNTRWEETTKAVVTMATFMFLASGTVYALYAQKHAGVSTFIDALYFTTATVTTTGFGDVTLPGTMGKLISIVIMVAGVTLFVRLAQAVIKPAKVRFSCPTCGLGTHDQDAVHCKACGVLINIPNED